MSGEPQNPKNSEHFEPENANLKNSSRADAPEAHNQEQSDEEAQAQSVAEDALAQGGGVAAGSDGVTGDSVGAEESLSDSRKPATGGEADDVQDVVDHMVQMDRSGRIDMDAYRGERSDDDEEGALGPSGVERSVPRGAE